MLLKGLLLAGVATIASGFLGVVYEMIAKKRYNIFEFMIYIQGFGLVFGLALTLALRLPLLNSKIFYLACIGSVTYLITLTAYLKAARERDIGANWSILHLSVTVPVIFSLVYFHDRFTTLKGIGLALVVISVIVIGGRGKKSLGEKLSLSWVTFIFIAFLMNGWAAVIFRFVPKRFAALFTLYFYSITFVAVLTRKIFVRGWPSSGLMLAGLGGAAAQWLGVMMTILSLDIVSKVNPQAGLIVYPIANGLGTPVGVLLGALLLHQHITIRAWFGIACGLAALLCLTL
jgi:drug/metabolite transporter (DMT)-like permease